MKNLPEFPEHTTDRDVYYNYCLWEYEPVSETKGKWRSATLLYHSFEYAGMDEQAYELVRVIREALGTLHTVWGVKHGDGKIFWEFYFYDYRRRDRERSISRLLQAVKPLIGCDVAVSENIHYFMFSIDISSELFSGGRKLDKIHTYIGNPGSNVSSGICYSFTENNRKLENLYYFFNPGKHMEDIIAKVCCSAFIDTPKIDIDQILLPELVRCRTICLANKPEHDCVYFAGITVDQLLYFLELLNYPGQLVSFIRDNRAQLDHLLYDVGIDYRFENDKVLFLKSGYYGNF